MERYKKFRKSLTKKQRKELDSQILFLRTAMVSSMTSIIEKGYVAFPDDNGWIPCYELMIQVCDAVLFNDESEFITYFEQWFASDSKDTELWNIWQEKHGTCYDWYFMDKANEKLAEELKGFEN